MGYEMGKRYEELEIGEEASFSKTITETDVYLFAGITGDFNPLHVDEEFAKGTRFKAPTYFGDTITVRARVAEKMEEKRWVRMALNWTNQKGVTIVAGEAVVIPPRKDVS